MSSSKGALLCRALDARYPKQVDAAVNKALKPSGGRTSGKAGSRDTLERGAGAEAAQRVAEFLSGALEKHSAQLPLPDASSTLACAIDAASAELRRLVSSMSTPLVRCFVPGSPRTA